MFITFADAKNSRLRDVASSCPTSDEFKSLVNEATERLMRRGDWAGVIVPIHLCSFGGCVVFPRYVGQVRKLNVCKHPVPIRNMWWDFFEDRDRHHWSHWCGDQMMTTPVGRTPVFQDIMGDGRLVRLYPQVLADVGKTVTIFGLDNDGQVLRTFNATTNTYSDGVAITLASPFGSSATFIRSIDRMLVQDGMQGDIFGYAYNAAQDVLEQLVTISPGDTNPSFVRYQVHAPSGCGINQTSTGTCGCSKPLVALVKLRFVPVRVDNDIILIENIPALKLMIQSIKKEEAGDEEAARNKERSAIRELNLQLRDEFPDDQIPIDFGETGGTMVGIQQCF